MTANDKANGFLQRHALPIIVGQLCIFVGYVAVDRIATEKRTTQSEERLSALYLQLPRLRDEQATQDARLSNLEHQVVKMEADVAHVMQAPAATPAPKQERRRLLRK